LDTQYITAMARGAPTSWVQLRRSSHADTFTTLALLLAQNLATLPLVFSISYGAPESTASTSLVDFVNKIGQKVALTGRTIVASSGDNGAMFSSCNDGYKPQFPASSPWVLAVGATQGAESGTAEIVCQSQYGGVITSGGGFSTFCPTPAWQASQVSGYFTAASVAGKSPSPGYAAGGRGYPDVSLAGAAYQVVVGGKLNTLYGTSASAPAVAGMITLINAARLAVGKPPVGFVNPALYAAASTPGVFNDITSGSINCLASSTSSVTCCTQGYTAVAGW